MFIRRANQMDIERIKCCERQLFGHNYSQELYNDIIKQDKSFVVIYNDTIVGYCLVSINGKFDTIMTFGILKQFQQLGFGSLLFKKVLNELKTQCSIITLRVKADNIIAINLYKKFGFTHDQEPDFFNTLTMKLVLNY